MQKSVHKIALMAVGDDGWQGGIQYISNILHALNAVGKDKQLEVHLFRHAAQNFSNLEQLDQIKIIEHDTEEVFEPWNMKNRIQWYLQRKWGGRINPRMENYLLQLNVDYVFPATLSSCNGKLNAGSWIADFQYHHFPDGARKDVNADAERVISNIAHHTDKIVLSSHFCEEDCVRLFPNTKGKTHVMPFAVAIEEKSLEFRDFNRIRQQYELPEKFLLVANLFAPTKNHQTIFNALGILKKRGLEIPLICTGNIVDYRNEAYANEVLQMLTKNRIRSQVYLLGLVPRADQLAMFRMATAMLQPSLNEGWSTSVEEAKCLGKHLFVSDIPVHKEQCSDNSLMFKATDAEDLATKIEKLWHETASVSFPDLETERKAFTMYKEKIKAFGQRFLEIASS